jgi:hypothetical protein
MITAIAKKVAYKEASTALKDMIKKTPSRTEALKLLESIVPDVPPLTEDKILPSKGYPMTEQRDRRNTIVTPICG